METKEISLHQIKVYLAVKAAGKNWMTAKDISDHSGVAQRTARSHALKFVNLGLFDQVDVFPANRYRLSETSEQSNKGYLLRIEKAMSAFGIQSIHS